MPYNFYDRLIKTTPKELHCSECNGWITITNMDDVIAFCSQKCLNKYTNKIVTKIALIFKPTED